MNRRGFIKSVAAGCVYVSTPSFCVANALNANQTAHNVSGANTKIIWLLLRGGLDGLHTVIPRQDTDVLALRPNLLAKVQSQSLPLNNAFGLHPKLPFLHQLYRQQQMSPVIATATGYRRRSHFDAQDYIESGLAVTDHEDGWLARALAHTTGQGMAIARSVPIALREPQRNADTWFPSGFAEVEDDLHSRLSDMYQDDPLLRHTLEKVIKQNNNPMMQVKGKHKTNFASLAQNCGKLMASNPDIRCAMLEFNGWDTHINQANRLNNKFTQLNKGLMALHQSLGETWNDTLLIINTEFGRTVAENGTTGTDHGTGGCMFFAGGGLAKMSNNVAAIQQKQSLSDCIIEGGKVLGTWPGAAPEQLFNYRDLMPTSDVKGWLASALMQHWGLNHSQVNNVFPEVV